MIRFLTGLYDRLEKRRPLLWLLILATAGLMAFFAFRLDYSEDISDFFPDAGGEAFADLKMKDKTVFIISGSDDPYELCDAADLLADKLQASLDEGLLSRVDAGVDAGTMDSAADFIYERLPLYLDEEDYARLDSLTTPEGIREAVENCHALLSTPAGMVMGRILLRDPLALATDRLQSFNDFSDGGEYELVGGHIFSKDMQNLLMFADPASSMGETGSNARLDRELKKACAETAEESGMKVEYFGSASVAAGNAEVIKKDTLLTVFIALLAIILLISVSFRSKAAIALIIAPVGYGSLFALCLIHFIQGSISAIAVGAGAAVLGVALSYSIHVVAHSNHCHDPKRIIVEMAYPLTLGSFTTIAAFAALIFTTSSLLHDFGLFASLTLIGTTIFCLVFLPHFLRSEKGKEKRKAQILVEKAVDYPLDRNRWVAGGVLLLIVVCAFFCGKVRFDADMNKLNWMSPEMKAAEARLESITGGNEGCYLISSGEDMDEARENYLALRVALDSLRAAGSIGNCACAGDYVFTEEEQRASLERWNGWWAGKRENVRNMLRSEALRAGFRENAFAGFEQLMDREYEICEWKPETLESSPLLRDWISNEDGKALLVSRISIDENQKAEVYKALEDCAGCAIADRGYWAGRMAEDISDDFNFILYISSIIVFLALWISYGRLELAILAFLPMLAGWVVILGLMAMLGIEFNIVSIILATFIFGIGDDFSIFIMDGLMARHRDGSSLLSSHKSAIFYSALTLLIGLGVLVIARHPAMKSIGLVTVLGIGVVLLMEFTIQPLLFRLLVSKPASKHLYPAELPCILHSIWIWGILVSGFIVTDILAGLLCITPLPERWKKNFFHYWCHGFCKNFIRIVPTVRFIRRGEENMDGRPAVIIANHQSLLDVIMLIALTPKLVMITKGGVFRNPLLGPIVRYSDFLDAGKGFDRMPEKIGSKIEEGYSIAVFPEATRSFDGDIIRFHKGAFMLAEQYDLDILPVVYYGTGYVCPKGQDQQCRPSLFARVVFPKVAWNDPRFGEDARSRAKLWRKWFAAEYEKLNAEFNHVGTNFYVGRALLSNYLYRGADLWRETRRECRASGFWDKMERSIARDACIVDLACGTGARALLLAMLSHGRKVTGIDACAENIEIARGCYMAGGRYGGARSNVEFICADPREAELCEADVFIVGGSLAEDLALLEKCRSRLREGGRIIIPQGKDFIEMK